MTDEIFKQSNIQHFPKIAELQVCRSCFLWRDAFSKCVSARFGTFRYFEKITIPRYKSSHQRCSVKNAVLKNFAKFTGKHLCQSTFLNKVAGCRPQACNFIKNETRKKILLRKSSEHLYYRTLSDDCLCRYP